MKKLYYPIILIIVIIVTLIALLIKNDIIILKKGKIDNLRYTITDKEFKVSSKIVDHNADHNTLDITYQYPETGLKESSLTKINTNASIYKIKNISEDVAIFL